MLLIQTLPARFDGEGEVLSEAGVPSWFANEVQLRYRDGGWRVTALGNADLLTP